MTDNRKEQAKIPVGRPGATIRTGIVRAARIAPDGSNSPKEQFFWWASEDLKAVPDTSMLHGPFDTEAEANQAARTAIVGHDDYKVVECGQWDPAWAKPQ
jgi:hypothetical protein